jgi:hypothetical protein
LLLSEKETKESRKGRKKERKKTKCKYFDRDNNASSKDGQFSDCKNLRVLWERMKQLPRTVHLYTRQLSQKYEDEPRE